MSLFGAHDTNLAQMIRGREHRQQANDALYGIGRGTFVQRDPRWDAMFQALDEAGAGEVGLEASGAPLPSTMFDPSVQTSAVDAMPSRSFGNVRNFALEGINKAARRRR